MTGDTKVVERGRCDGLYVTTAGVGLAGGPSSRPGRIAEGDAVILSGDIGRHGMAIMAVREGLDFESPSRATARPFGRPSARSSTQASGPLPEGSHPRRPGDRARSSWRRPGACDRRGRASRAVGEAVRGACEILGLEALYVANEGRFVCFVPEAAAPLRLWRSSRAQPPGGRPPSSGGARLGARGGASAERDRRRAGPPPPQRRAASSDLLGHEQSEL